MTTTTAETKCANAGTNTNVDVREEARATIEAFRKEIAAETPPGRVAELVRLIEADREIASRPDFSEESMAALARVTEAEKELFLLRPKTAEDAHAVLRMIRREYIEERVGEELGWGEFGVLYLLDGLDQFIRGQQAR